MDVIYYTVLILSIQSFFAQVACTGKVVVLNWIIVIACRMVNAP